jgi:hypothetical protein
MKILVLIASFAIPALACGQGTTSSPEPRQHQSTSDQNAVGVDARGDHAMGFSHQSSTHHFRLLSDGGAIQVSANDPKDTATRDEIRMHLSHIAKMFAEGDFQVPMFIHDTVPPGVPVMKANRSAIVFTFEPTPDGGRVRIASANTNAIDAIHQFLAFQIDDHRTGDSKVVAPLR